MKDERENVIDELEEYKNFMKKIDKATLSEPLNNQIKMVSVAIYVRVSTEEQKKDGFSIRAQIEKLTQYASIKEWVVFDIYNDQGISGKNIEERPALKRMIEDIKNDKVQVVLVFKLDRLTRSIRDLMELTDIFNEYKCEFCSLTENIDTHSASGRMFLKILGIFAEFERENLIERVRGGFERKAKEGYTNARSIPAFGYTRQKGDKILTINEKEAEIVRYIFKEFVEDFKGEFKIAKELNCKQVPTKLGGLWTSTTVRDILTNQTYIGKIRYAMNDKKRYTIFDGKHEPLVSDEIFQKAQDIINNRAKVIKTKRPKQDAYFSGLLKCSKCGSKMTAHRNYKRLADGREVSYIQYICKKSHYSSCGQHSINNKKLENAFLEYIDNVEPLTEIDEIALPENTIEDNEAQITKLQEEISKLDVRKRKIMQLFLKDSLDLKEYKEMTMLIEKEIALLENNILDLEEIQNEEEISINKEDIILSIAENWALFNDFEKMNFLQTFVEGIEVDCEKEENTRNNKVKVKNISFAKK